MAERDYFDLSIAVNPSGEEWTPVAGAVFQAYAVDDLSYSTALTIQDPISGATISTLRSSTLGGLRPFSVVGDPQQVILKSGSFVTRLTSMYGRRGVSAYDLALTGGFVGSEEEFSTLLAKTGDMLTGLLIEDGTLSATSADGTVLEVGEIGSGGSGPGTPGREVQISASSTFLQWRYVGDSAWTPLVALADLRGANARDVQFLVNATHIQWRYVGDVSWSNLVALADLRGPAGASVQMRVNGGYFQWKLSTDSTWTNLIEVSSGGGSGRMVYYSGSAWPSRPAGTDPVMAIATKYPGAPDPSWLEVGDMVLRHPDDI